MEENSNKEVILFWIKKGENNKDEN